MSLSAGSSQLQAGDWNKPQVISFDSLFTTYSIENAFESEEVKRMMPILLKWKDLTRGHFSIKKLRDRPAVASYMTNCPTITRRTAHVKFDETPDIIYKTYYPNSSSLHPMATTLRAPMASLIQETITKDNASKIGVTEKGLFPLFSKEIISQLDEKSINEAFVVCAKKVNVFGPKETREAIKTLPRESQLVLANQTCNILMKTGLGDCTWENLQMHRDNEKLYILDTETLGGELFIDKFGAGFEECADAMNDCALSSCAKAGLKLFQVSSDLHKMEIFENTAASYLEKID
ncbi:MAG TPA: hypothetical protein VIJ14_01710 [Rhabdochlamydiaceae bacterium]